MKYEIWGWALFLLCALAFAVVALRAAEEKNKMLRVGILVVARELKTAAGDPYRISEPFPTTWEVWIDDSGRMYAKERKP